MATIDVNHPPAGGFKNGEWYWDPAAGDARQAWNGKLGPPGVINNPNQQGYQQPVGRSASAAKSGTVASSPLEEVNKAITDSYAKLQADVVKKFGDYTAGHPFNIDQVLAEKTTQAKEQIDPYYDQILGDYLSGVQRKLDRGVNDTRDLLAELSSSTASYTESAKNTLDNAVNNAEQGFADNGLFGSGTQLTATGQIKQATGANLADYTRKANLQAKQLTTGLARNNEDINAASTDFQTNLARSRYTDTSTLASNLTKEAGQQYVQGFQATLPPELQSSSGFDMLKSLGIYS